MCLLEATLLPYFPDTFALQIWLPLAVWLGLQKDWSVSGLVLVGLLFPIEWASSGRMGLISLGLIVTFFLIRASGMSASALRLVGLALLGAVSAVTHGLVMCAVLWVFDPDSAVISAIAWTIWQSTAVSAITTPVVVRGLMRLNEMYSPRSRFGVSRR